MSTELTKVIANFSTQIITNVSAGGETTTLASNLDKQGNVLPTGTYCFTLNQGKSNEQHFLCTVTGVGVTEVRGVSHAGVISTGFLQDARINDSVKLTDYLNLLTIVKLLTAQRGLDAGAPIFYDGAPALTDPRQVPDKAYTDTKVDKTGNNTLSGDNIHSGESDFTDKVRVPTATMPTEAINKAQMEAIASGTIPIIGGFRNATITFDGVGRVSTVTDTTYSVTYTITYVNAEDEDMASITDGTNTWTLTYDIDGNITNITQS